MINFYYGKYYVVYVVKMNVVIEGMDLENVILEDIIQVCIGVDSNQVFFNNVVQVWNYFFYWVCMLGKGGGQLGVFLVVVFE